MVRINAFEWLWNYQVDQLKEFLRSTEAAVTSEFDEFSKWVGDETKEMSDDEIQEFIDHYYDDLAMVRDILPNLQRYAQLLVIYGAFENQIGGLCRLLHADQKAARKPAKNIYLDVAETYLRKSGIGSSGFGTEWKFLAAAKLVRNAVAHNGGTLRKDSARRRAQAFIAKRKDLSVNGSNQINIENGFCDEVLSQATVVVGKLIDEAKKLY